jgi:hypothetical protein
MLKPRVAGHMLSARAQADANIEAGLRRSGVQVWTPRTRRDETEELNAAAQLLTDEEEEGDANSPPGASVESRAMARVATAQQTNMEQREMQIDQAYKLRQLGKQATEVEYWTAGLQANQADSQLQRARRERAARWANTGLPGVPWPDELRFPSPLGWEKDNKKLLFVAAHNAADFLRARRTTRRKCIAATTAMVSCASIASLTYWTYKDGLWDGQGNAPSLAYMVVRNRIAQLLSSSTGMLN